MPTGNVKWFDVKKGFGFIVGPEGQDVFVHFSSIGGDGFKTLKDGEPVEYVLHEGDKGFHAREVRRLAAPRAESASDGDGAVSPTTGERSRMPQIDGTPSSMMSAASAQGASAGATASSGS